MPPEELPKRSAPSRAPYVRRPVSVDGISPRPMQRPQPPVRRGEYMQRSPSAGIPASQTVPLVPAPVPPVVSAPPAALAAPAVPPAKTAPMPSLDVVAAHPPAEIPHNPKAPAKTRRWIMRAIVVVLALAALAAAVGGWLHWQAQRNDPDKIFQEALNLSLSIKQVHTQTTSENIAQTTSGTTSSQVDYDFSSPADPTVSSDNTVKIGGANFGVAGYGSAKNSFISYTKLPDFIAQDTATAVGGSWVRMREDGRLPTGTSSVLANLADPRYRDFGVIILGKYTPQTRQELVNFMLANRVYTYNKQQVHKRQLGNVPVLVYSVKLNSNYLKIANQSAAANLKFQPEEVKAAVDALDHIKNNQAIIYVSTSTHRIQQLEFTGLDGRTTVTFEQYDHVTMPGEPQTKLTWKDFTPSYNQITAQVAANQAKSLTKTQH